MRRVRWQHFIFLSVLTFILAGPVYGGGMPGGSKVGIYTDYGSFLGEYQTAGALAFYYNTEAALRLAQFEKALMRYRFLKGKIRRSVDYRGLLDMVDLRLRFLKKQMHLTNRDIAPIPPRRAWIPQKVTPKPKVASKKKAAAKPKTPAAAAKNRNKQKALVTIPGRVSPLYRIPRPSAKVGAPPGKASPPVTRTPPATVAPGAAVAPPATTAPTVTATQQLPPVVTTTPESKEQKEDDAEEKKETKKALSVWDKMKLRLNLFR